MKTKIADVQIIRKAMNWTVPENWDRCDLRWFVDAMASVNWRKDNWANGDVYFRVGNSVPVGFLTLEGSCFLAPSMIS